MSSAAVNSGQLGSTSTDLLVKQSIFPSVVPGPLNAGNDGAIDWGWQGFIAYGCQSAVIILDARSVHRVQVLDQHKHIVSQVKWARENHYHNLRHPYHLRLASADLHGQIIVWDVVKGAVQTRFSDSDRPISDMAWHWHQDSSHDMLLVLHPNSVFVLWNAQTGTVIWKRTFRTDQLETIALDPHCANRAIFTSQNGVWLQTDLSLYKASTNDLVKISLPETSNNHHSKTPETIPRSGSSSLLKDANSTSLSSVVKNRAARFLPRGQTSSVSSLDEASILEIHFHPIMKDVLIIVHPRMIAYYSLRYSAVFRRIFIEKNSPSLLAIFPMRLLHGFHCLHVNGCLSLRIVKDESAARFSSTATCEVSFLAESSRLIKQAKIQGFVVEPVLENKLVVFLSDGRLLTYSLDPLALHPAGFHSRTDPSIPRLFLSNFTHPLHPPPSVIHCGPPNTRLMAIGTSRGSVQLLSLQSMETIAEFSVSSYPVQGIEWINEAEILLFAFPVLSSPSSLVKSEIIVVNILTGEVNVLRKSNAEESPIRVVKVSTKREHFVVVFRNARPEVWSLSAGKPLLWRTPKSVPKATTAEWITVVVQTEGSPKDESRKDRRELLLFVTDNGTFSPYLIKGNVMMEDQTSVFTTQITIGHVTWMSRKKNKIIIGDVDGSFIKWVPAEGSAESKNLNRGWIRSIRFSPKERAMWAAVLFSDGIDVWEVETMELINQLTPKLYKVASLDWVSATHIALACTDGLIRIFDCRNMITSSVVAGGQELNPNGLLPHPYLLRQDLLVKLKSSFLLNGDPSLLTVSGLNLPVTEDGNGDGPSWSVVDRGILAAVALGDENDLAFWTACLKGLPCKSSRLKALLSNAASCPVLQSKESFLDVAKTVLENQSALSKTAARTCVRDLVLAGETHQATEYLLNHLDPNDEHYYSNCLKAALIASLCEPSSESVHSTIKMVATDLIAHRPSDNSGVELLCMIGKHVDACRYLIATGNHLDAVLLARMSLGNPMEQKDVVMKWIDHLGHPENNQKSLALNVAVSCGYLETALELMATSRQFERACLFLKAVEEDGVEETVLEKNGNVREAVFLEYARQLQQTGLIQEALSYCDKGGVNGQLLRKEFQILSD